MTRIFLTSLPLLALAACGGGDSTGKSTTKLDAVEVQPGSISDSMIVLDNVAGDGTAVDNSIPDDDTKKDAPKAEAASEGDEAASDDGDDPEAVDMPIAKKAITDDAAAKKGE
ncbi:hypothetical protein OVY29_06635 [Sphingopyxis sp. SE2]|jgi:hypothetical protein|uniref:hypothetical protein n=1 Tax=unclassified Sphingopyxis TaxID=2614943 RepID=UPI00050DBABC|nr:MULTISPECIES: hypothetical protein [unclassified Sphingopyxis]KGB58777.1 hypothetical protein FG95_00636 [Sphingopyxis sp. LC363]MDT7528325.1 hypothetical protein [Sphingopyxis sp. SE2]